jgi:hypothetical protein
LAVLPPQRGAALCCLYEGIDFFGCKPRQTQGDNFVHREIDSFIAVLVRLDGKANGFYWGLAGVFFSDC